MTESRIKTTVRCFGQEAEVKYVAFKYSFRVERFPFVGIAESARYRVDPPRTTPGPNDLGWEFWLRLSGIGGNEYVNIDSGRAWGIEQIAAALDEAALKRVREFREWGESKAT